MARRTDGRFETVPAQPGTLSRPRAWIGRVLLAAAVAAPAVTAAQTAATDALAERVRLLARDTVWRAVSATPVTFDTHHPQGMVKIGDTLFVSSVEVTTPTTRFAEPTGGYDRDTGAGVGHLFKMTLDGTRLADLRLGEGTIYHPGGIDFDGRHIWVSVAEYRPNSRSIVYRVDPETMQASEVFRFGDHLGAIVHDPGSRTLHGVSWGSRRFYRWTLDRTGRVTNASAPPASVRTINPSHYVDYQDCKSAGRQRMLCTGVADLRASRTAPPFRLGGLDLIDLRDGRPIHQVPVLLWTPGGLDLTHNPAWFEPTATGLRGYFMPEDGRSTIYVYEADVRR